MNLQTGEKRLKVFTCKGFEMRSMETKRLKTFGVAILAALLAAPMVGCQVTRNGQTLPSPYYLEDDIQYHPSGTEFQYQQEVDYMNKANAEKAAAAAQYGQY